ncbi:hypothetical protein PSMK_19480 [Phycisphaera mikurensis NBRC 102666]|uniref:Polyprenyl synthetase n=1 Tax=Phycisphaera mikurensis (strain NBRC 102666 / KCTC 22515 / FYK2301M01) TaxID=1142394 RepID=I0IFR9_PHYMF|nr:hypothetical protein PSMK_19480 [Phycisphaera mikurensis NBRC 102666]
MLAGGVALAQAAAALPDDEDGRRWRAATPALVGLHVLAGRLVGAEGEPIGRTRARVLLGQHRRALQRAFGAAGVPAAAAGLAEEVERLLARPPAGRG